MLFNKCLSIRINTYKYIFFNSFRVHLERLIHKELKRVNTF